MPALPALREPGWIEGQPQALLPGTYFLITFTLPQELRALVGSHQRLVYGLLMQCAWDTLAQFSRNHRQLKGSAGAVGVLHTHSRRLEFHPHVHLAMPGAAFDAEHGLWRSLRKTNKDGCYLFNHKALAAVFRGKLLAALNAQGLTVPLCLPERWVVDCKSVGNGEKALVYLGRYLYRGVIQERDILRCADSQVTFRYRDSASGKNTTRTVSGAHFLWLVLQHVKPQGISALTQLWLAPSQLQAPPTADAVAHGAQAQRDGVLPGGHAVLYTATLERAPQTEVPVLRLADGDRAPTHRTPRIQGWRGSAARCSTRGSHDLSSQRENRHWPAACPKGLVVVLGQKWLLASSHPCNEGGRGNKNCPCQADCATRASVPGKLPGYVFCTGHRPHGPGSSNRRFRSWLRTI